MWAIIQIFVQAPRAVIAGRFHVDETHSIYGWKARVVGGLLLYIGLVWGIGAPILYASGIKLPPEAIIFGVITVIGSVIVAAVICAVCQKRRRPDIEHDDANGDW
jgi:hypothetical protein